MKCITCNKEFTPVRATAKYCSDKCRVQASRLSVTKEKVSVTNIPKEFLGYDENNNEVDLRDVDYSHKEVPIHRTKDCGVFQWAKVDSYGITQDYIPGWRHAGYKSKKDALECLMRIAPKIEFDKKLSTIPLSELVS